MEHRRLGRSGVELSPIGFGAFKIGRNQGVKYAQGYELPDMGAVERLLNGVLDLGVTYFDTAPAYGLSEERIGAAIGHRNDEFIVSTKVGEEFENGRSRFDFAGPAVRASIERSLRRLKRERLDMVFIHSDGNDLHVLQQTEAAAELHEMKSRGLVRLVGFSGKTVEGAQAALADGRFDALMVEYHSDDQSHEAIIAEAGRRGVGIIVKKGLASGRLDARSAIPFVLNNSHVTSMVVGGLNLEHIQQNVRIAEST